MATTSLGVAGGMGRPVAEKQEPSSFLDDPIFRFKQRQLHDLGNLHAFTVISENVEAGH